jgi:hypothetical protein
MLLQKLLPNPPATTLLPATSKVIASLNPVEPNSLVGIGPTISQFPANGLRGAGGTRPPPQPDSNNPIPQAGKLNKAEIFMWLKL